MYELYLDVQRQLPGGDDLLLEFNIKIGVEAGR